MRQYKPLPKELSLAPTLARRVNQLREFRNLTVKDLAKFARLQPQRIEDIEAGLETWLSSTDRQRLAKALSVEPYLIQDVETKSSLMDEDAQRITTERLTAAILQGARELECPQCSSTLKCSVQEARDLEDNPTQFAKAFCLKCPYVLR